MWKFIYWRQIYSNPFDITSNFEFESLKYMMNANEYITQRFKTMRSNIKYKSIKHQILKEKSN